MRLVTAARASRQALVIAGLSGGSIVRKPGKSNICESCVPLYENNAPFGISYRFIAFLGPVLGPRPLMRRHKKTIANC